MPTTLPVALQRLRLVAAVDVFSHDYLLWVLKDAVEETASRQSCPRRVLVILAVGVGVNLVAVEVVFIAVLCLDRTRRASRGRRRRLLQFCMLVSLTAVVVILDVAARGSLLRRG